MKSFKEFLKEVATVKNNKPGLMKTGFIARGFVPLLPGKIKKK